MKKILIALMMLICVIMTVNAYPHYYWGCGYGRWGYNHRPCLGGYWGYRNGWYTPRCYPHRFTYGPFEKIYRAPIVPPRPVVPAYAPVVVAPYGYGYGGGVYVGW